MTESQTLHDLLRKKTDGKPFVFVIMDYKKNFHVYKDVQDVVVRLGMACLRADHLETSGADLQAKIHLLIQRADIVVAELSTDSPNVFYEIGYTVALGKRPILLCDQNTIVPTDLRGREVIRHGGSEEASSRFSRELELHLRACIDNSQTGLLRDLLIPEQPEPAFIVASPKSPSHSSRAASEVFDRRTFSDNIGILGLITSFASVLGVARQLELVSAGHLPPDFCHDPLLPKNLYFIGSRKVNKPGGEMLNRIQQGKTVQWQFGPQDGEPEFDADRNPINYQVRLFRKDESSRTEISGLTIRRQLEDGRSGLVHLNDHGIIVRAPHPDFPDRVVVIMAGPHPLGTAAACMAATRPSMINKFKEKLNEAYHRHPSKSEDSQAEHSRQFDFADKSKPFWVLVKGEASETDNLLDEKGVTIVDAGFY